MYINIHIGTYTSFLRIKANKNDGLEIGGQWLADTIPHAQRPRQVRGWFWSFRSGKRVGLPSAQAAAQGVVAFRGSRYVARTSFLDVQTRQLFLNTSCETFREGCRDRKCTCCEGCFGLAAFHLLTLPTFAAGVWGDVCLRFVTTAASTPSRQRVCYDTIHIGPLFCLANTLCMMAWLNCHPN